MPWVVDASVGAKWLVPEAGSELATELLDDELWVPDLFFAEIANILWKKRARGESSEESVDLAAQWLACVPLHVHDCRSLIAPALKLAGELGHPAYDCLYLALSLEVGHPAVTADRRLFDRCHAAGSASLIASIVWLPTLKGGIGP